MPAIRLTSRTRRRSSHAIFTPAKPGIYGPRPVTFAPNVTPITYVETDDDDLSPPPSPSSPSSQHITLFPPSSTPAPPPARKRCPPGKRRSQGYIPRPPNAFMLFRADFVRQKHVPGSIETNHGSLSKIIGNCWRQLPLDEKRLWEIKAKQEKANHKAQFPDYRFRPVHNKNKNKDKSASNTTTTKSTSSSLTNNPDGTTHEEEERRCEQVAQLLLGGMKGDELARAVRDLDRVREEQVASSRANTSSHSDTLLSSNNNAFESESLAMPIPMSSFQNPFAFGGFGYGNSNSGLALPPSAYRRRSSSVPLPFANASSDFLSPFGGPGYTAPAHFDMTGIALPSVPYISQTRPSSPINNISRQHQQRAVLGHRRASSAQPVYRRSWTYPGATANLGIGNTFAQTDFSVFDWAGVDMGVNNRDGSPLPDVDPELFNGFSFEGAVDPTTTTSLPLQSEISSSASVSSTSNRNSPWLETPHTHSQHASISMAIAPHDLPPLDISSSDMNWRDPVGQQAQPTALLSATSSSSSSTFPSPSLSSTTVPVFGNGNEKLDPNATPTNGIFEMGLGMDFMGMGIGMDGNSAGGGDYGYGYNETEIGFGSGGDMGMVGVGYGNHGIPGGHDLGMGIGMDDTMWQAQQS